MNQNTHDFLNKLSTKTLHLIVINLDVETFNKPDHKTALFAVEVREIVTARYN